MDKNLGRDALWAIVDNLVDGMVLIDDQGTICEFNQAAVRIFGYGTDEAVGENITMLMSTENALAHQQSFSGYLSNGPSKQSEIVDAGLVEVVGQRKDGDGVPLEMSVIETGLEGARFFVGTFRDISKRRAAEAEVELQSQLNNLAFEAVAHAFAIYDADLKIAGFNTHFEEYFQLPKGFLTVGTGLDDVLRQLAIQGHFPDRDVDEVIANRLAFFRSGDVERREERRLPDGRTYIFQHKPMPGGGFVTSYTDISEIKKAERAAEKQATLLHVTVESMAQAFVHWDEDKRLLAYNSRYEKMFGFPKGFLKSGMSIEETINFRSERGLFGRIFKDEGETSAWHRRRADDLGERTGQRILQDGTEYLYHRKPLPDGRGFVTTYTDISELKEARREVEEKTAILASTFENMVQGIAVFNETGHLTTYNHRFVEILKLPSGFLTSGMGRDDFFKTLINRGEFLESDMEKLMEHHASTRDMKDIFPNEHIMADGTAYIFEMTPIDGGGTIATVTDVTERKRVAEQLLQAQKMEAVGQLTGGIAHDFNNLLAVTQGNLELAIESSDANSDGESGKTNSFLDAALLSTQRGAALTYQLLAFGRKQALNPESVDVNDLVSEMLELIRRTLSRSIEIDIRPSPNLWHTHIDRTQLQTAVLNLILNSRDAMPDGGRITIMTSNVEIDEGILKGREYLEPGAYVLMQVADTGFGMSGEAIEHAFEPFFTTKDVGHGSGLGLSMVYGFARQSGGHVFVDSTQGEGTVFQIYLPRSYADDVPAIEVNVELHDVQGRGERILLVEDDDDVRKTTAKMLENAGYVVTSLGEGKMALAVLSETAGTPDAHTLLLTDIILKGAMNGIELSEQALHQNKNLKVLFMSGYASDEGFAKSDLAPCVNFLQKPFSMLDLLGFVRRTVDRVLV
ncbi:MAG: PAS domain S-box protein [Rhodospirillales bacterium]|nr:PAS domain S-box protein [Rhodospirillales bacterium]MBT5076954.1 PAS domain S-box protein [Rhodospirillales bacterium]MBT5113597.1 PAS domain S-box protein [Rhodospirillales bacterium]MBT5673895.1 PAS domain S-box protein [Rhodospirillales bacterium]MBT6186553.1 PAS domain S-box protein [Rhodospirillales bacterium]